MPRKPERIVITGMGIASPIGCDPDTVSLALREGRSGVRAMPDWRDVDGLGAHVAALVDGLDLQAMIPRKFRRSMGRVAQLCYYAVERATAMAGVSAEARASGRVGLSIGSTTGSPAATLDYYANIIGPGMRANKSTAFLQVMSHTCAANMALAFGVTGRVWAPNSACTSASQAIGLAFDTLRAGAQDVMICGGAEEAHYTTAGTFDLSGAASRAYNDRPEMTPRPFDRDRDGMVVGEGAGILVLERRDHALARGVPILGEIVAFSSTCDGGHMTSPEAAGMQACIGRALADADLKPTDIDYINAHATGTELGDIAEAQATHAVFADGVPISSTKGYMGHTLGACGAIEAILGVLMLRDGFIAGGKNLENIDPRCAGPDFIRTSRAATLHYIMSNNFAFGGINTSLILAPGG